MTRQPASLAGVTGLNQADLTVLMADLAASGVTVACAESLTGGLLSAVLTEIPGASTVVRGGLVVYATDLKNTLAGVDQGLLDERGPVDPDVAIALAEGVREVCGSTVGIGLTGVAGPDPQNGVEVGTWYVALAGRTPAGTDVRWLSSGVPVTQPADVRTRAGVRHAALRAAIGLLVRLVATDAGSSGRSA